MKKTWKKLLCTMMLAPCMFMATACGDEPDDPSNQTVDLTIEQQQEAYTTLRNVVSTALNNDGSKDQAYTLQYSNDYKQVMNLDNSGLSTESRNSLGESFGQYRSDKVTKTIYGGYKTNNTGYKAEVIKFINADGSNNSTQTNSEIVKYNGQYYELYENKDSEKTISKVSNLYARNALIADDDMLFGGADYQKLSLIVNQTKDNETFDAFKNYLVNWTATTIAESKVKDADAQDFSQYVTTEYAFSLTDGVYSLKIDVALDATNSAYVFLEDGNMTGNGTMSILFDSKGIRRLDFNYETNMALQESSASVFAGYVNQEFTANDVVVTTTTNDIDMSLDFTTSFDDNYFGQSLTGYSGTGANGEVENVKVKATLALANAQLEDSTITVEFNYNDNLKTAIDNAMASILSENGLFIQLYYTISDGALTPITDTTLVPATEFSVYLELTTQLRDFVETSVTVYNVNTDTEESCAFYIDDKIYNEIKAVFGLTDSQIEGIYSDAELQNKLDSDALITENMVVYLVLTDGGNSNTDSSSNA